LGLGKKKEEMVNMVQRLLEGESMEECLGRSLSPGFQLRRETEDDFEFVVRLYASTRAEELATVPWPEEAKLAFLRSQCELQHAHYQKYYPHAELLVIERNRLPIGRLYVHQGTQEIRLMDIAFVPEQRGQGVGTCLVKALLAYAQTLGASVTLHVEPQSPAQRLYARLGFRLLEDRGVYHFLKWRPDGVS
jgi:ribosomal protein S18 acetylase RimI-like enzyme